MAQVTFSTVCNAFYRHMITPKKAGISRRLLNYVIEDENIVNEKGQPYFIQRKEYTEFFNGTKNLYPILRNSVSYYSVRQNIEDNISDLFDDLIKEDEHELVAKELLEALKLDNEIDANLKSEIESLDINDPYSIVAKIYIYALGNNNKTVSAPKKAEVVTPKDPEEAINEIIKLLGDLPKPVALDIPPEISATEMVYVSAILEAFAEDSGVLLVSQDELISKSEYAKYKRQFDRYRREYYAAESIRESIKDTKLLKDKDYFEELENEAYDAVIDKVEEPAATSYDRMTKVLSHATTITLSSLLARIPNWVRSNEKKGLCHILVNEERVKWKDD